MKKFFEKKVWAVKKNKTKKIRGYIYKITFIYYYYYFFFLSNHGLISSAPVISYHINPVLFFFLNMAYFSSPLKSTT